MKLRIVLALIAGVAAAGSAVALLATSAWLISRAAQQPPVLVLMVAIVAVRAFGLGRGVLRYAERLLGHDVAFRIQSRQRVDAYRRLERLLPGAAFSRGDLIARIVSDVDAVLDAIVRVSLPVAAAALTGAATAGLLAILLPAAGVVATVGVGLALLGIPLVVAWAGRTAERRLAPLRGELAQATTEALDAAPDLLAFGRVELISERLHEIGRRLARAEARASWSAGLGAALLALMVGTICLAGLAFGVPAVEAGALDEVLLAVVVLTPLALADVLGVLPMAALAWYRAGPAKARVAALSTIAPPVLEPARPLPIPGPPYTLEIRELGVRNINGLDISLPPGARVAVVGASGSGKTTLTQVLVRFLEPTSGQVTLNGVDLRYLDGDDVRRVVKLCEQEPYIFDTTLRENMRLAKPDATDAELREALRKARLLEWTESLPDGLDTLVGEHGARMSGGERQRLGLARCLLADSPIMIYDEPTEHLGEDAGRQILHDLLAAAGGRTVLIATHRQVESERSSGLLDDIVTLYRSDSARQPAVQTLLR